MAEIPRTSTKGLAHQHDTERIAERRIRPNDEVMGRDCIRWIFLHSM